MKTSEKILHFLDSHGLTASSELVNVLGITDRAVRKQLKQLLDTGQVQKSGRPPKVFYDLARGSDAVFSQTALETLPAEARALIEREFLYVTPRGTQEVGGQGFAYWCGQRDLDIVKMADQYQKIWEKYGDARTNGLIDGIRKMHTTFDSVWLDELYYVDFYSIEVFGKTKLGQKLLFAKQSQNRQMMNEIADTIHPRIVELMKDKHIETVGFIPPTVKRELQLMKQIEKRLDLPARKLRIEKIKTPVAVPQKTLTKLEDRIENAQETLVVRAPVGTGNILLIDDAVGSGATLNETARQIRRANPKCGRIVGLAITGSLKGFDVISEV